MKVQILKLGMIGLTFLSLTSWTETTAIAESTSYENDAEERYELRVENQSRIDKELEAQAIIQRDGDVRARYKTENESARAEMIRKERINTQKGMEKAEPLEVNQDRLLKKRSVQETQVKIESRVTIKK